MPNMNSDLLIVDTIKKKKKTLMYDAYIVLKSTSQIEKWKLNIKAKKKNKNRMSNSIIQDRVANLQMTASMKVNAGVRLLIAEESVGEL